MGPTLSERVERTSQRSRARKRRNWGLTVLSLLVGVTTLYALSRPAITASLPPVCGMEEHVHTDSCYRWVLVEDEIVELPDEDLPVEGQPSEEVPDETEAPGSSDETPEEAPAEDLPSEDAPAGDAPVSDDTDNNDANDSDGSSGDGQEAPALLQSLMNFFSQGPEDGEDTSEPDDGALSDPDAAPEGWHWEQELTCGQVEHVHEDRCYPEEEGLWTATRSEEEADLSGLPALMDLADTDISGYITDVAIRVNGEAFDGDSIVVDEGARLSIQLSYTLPENMVTPTQNIITYQLPVGLMSTEAVTDQAVYETSTTGEQVQVGTYSISESGLITITFNNEFANRGGEVTGSLTVGGYATHSGDGGDDSYVFTTTSDPVNVTVKPQQAQSDLTVTKAAAGDETDKAKVHYTVTVTGGTSCTETVTITDTLNAYGQNTVSYDQSSFVLVKLPGGEPVANATPVFSAESGIPSFTYTGLAPLGENEQYVLTYTATLNDGIAGDYWYNNTANVQEEGKKPQSATANGHFTRQYLSKSASYDQETGEILWTITVNQAGDDIGGWVLTDTLTLDGTPLVLPKTVHITPAVNDSDTIRFVDGKFTFPEGSSETYTITYTTTEVVENPGNYVNSAELDSPGGGHHTANSGVNTNANDSTDLQKKTAEGATDVDGGVVYSWKIDITVPEGGFPGLTKDGTVQAWQTDTTGDNHYFTSQTAETFQIVLTTEEGTSLLQAGEDYRLTFFSQPWQENDPYTPDQLQSDETLRLRQYRLDFLTDIPAGTLTIRYNTFGDLSGLAQGESRRFVNQAFLHVLDRVEQDDAQVEKTLPMDRLTKQGASAGLENGQTSVAGNTYTEDDMSVTFDREGTALHYRLLIDLNDLTGPLTLEDVLPQGTAYREGSFQLFYWTGNEYYQQPFDGTYAPTVDGGVLRATIEGYTANADSVLAIYYTLDIQDLSWITSGTGEHTFVNNATLTVGGDEYTASQEQTVVVPVLEKSGVQTDGTVTYQVVINPAGQDLSVTDTLHLSDDLDYTGDAAFVMLLQSSVALYRYDPAAEGGKGPVVSPLRYGFTYDAETQVTTFTLPDGMPLLLEYKYSYVPESPDSPAVVFSNTASLAGQGSVSSSVSLDNAWSSATADRGTLSFRKVNANNYALSLPGATFTFSQFDTVNNIWTVIGSFTTDDGGLVTFGKESSTVMPGLTLYKLVETKAPDGYRLDDTARYFVWAPSSFTTQDDVAAEMQATFAAAGLNAGDVSIYLGGNVVYIPNTYSNLEVQKLWLNADGDEIPAPVEEIRLNLYQQAMKPVGHTVTVEIYLPGSTEPKFTQSYTVASGSSLQVNCNTNWPVGQWDWTLSGDTSGNGTFQQTNNIWTYTSESIQSDCTLEFRAQGGWESAFSSASVDYTPATAFAPIAGSERVLYAGNIVLNAENGWHMAWDNLPATDDDGNPLYYTVEEETVDGYTVAYQGNTAQTGQILVLNTKSALVLPETGGIGTIPYSLGGLALLAASVLYTQQKIMNKRKEH